MSVSGSLRCSTPSAQQSQKSLDSSIFLTAVPKEKTPRTKKAKCLSAKNTGMRFQSWREPKPLRNPPSSAGHTEDPYVTPRRQSSPARRTRVPAADTEMADVIQRLSQPTMCSTSKSTKSRAREAGTDMNWYSWAKMNVYKDYQGVLYRNNGAMKRTIRGKER